MECWNPGSHGCLRTHPASLDAGHHAGMTKTFFFILCGFIPVAELNIMNHFVAQVLFLAADMDGKPDGFWIGALNSMFHMARNRHIVALVHAHKLSAFEFQSRFSTNYHDPLVLILIVPKTGRAAIRLRNNALDLD
jgi:hypothetical protein